MKFRRSLLLKSSACRDASERQQNHLVPQLLLPALYCLNIPWGAFCPITEVVKEDTGPTTSPWGMLLVTGLQLDFVPLTTRL